VRLGGLAGEFPAHARLGVWPNRALPLLTILFGALLRILPWLAAYPLHRDEALYGMWGRLIASGQDPLLLTPWVDKPPLVLYLIGASLRLLGTSERALRVPGMLASLLALPCLYGLLLRAYGPGARRLAVLALILYAASPFAILFAPTAFTDPWLSLWLLAALWAALARRPLLTGLALGLAIASKQQGVLVAPLAVAGLLLAPGPRRTPKVLILRLALALLGAGLVLGPVTWWDSLRWSNRPSFWDRSATTYGGLGFVPPAIWAQRAADWGLQLGYLYAWPALSGLALLGAAAVTGRAARRVVTAGAGGLEHEGAKGPQTAVVEEHEARRREDFRLLQPLGQTDASGQNQADGAAAWRLDLLLGGYVAGYLALHFLVSFQPWDRYLLPLVPLLAVLAARAALDAWDWTASAQTHRALYAPDDAPWWAIPARWLGAATLGVLLLAAGWQGATARIPVGSDHGAYFGLDRIVAELCAQPADAIIYHQWIGWHYDYYLFDAPQERRWWDTAWKLADDADQTALSQPWRSQWLAIPGWEDSVHGQITLALVSRGLRLAERLRTYRPDGSLSFTLYEIVQVKRDGR
jgi:4-amino-4-deoxy-L-arabinose transferase-like glycosyltransferase